MGRNAATASLALAFCLLGAAACHAGSADVVGVKVERTGPGIFRFDVSVRHGDSGWKHYADRWDVVGPDGKVLGSRKLLHPHEDEQPFTRSLAGVTIGAEVREVTIRAHDNMHGLGGKTMTVQVPH